MTVTNFQPLVFLGWEKPYLKEQKIDFLDFNEKKPFI